MISSLKKISAGIIQVSLLAFLAACAVGPKYERPSVSSPGHYRSDTSASTDTMLNLKWWEMFNDPYLDSLIKVALKNNKDVQIAASRIQQSRAYLGINRPDFYTQIGFGGGVIHGN